MTGLFADKTSPIPAWVPDEIRAELAGASYRWKRLPAQVRRRLRTPVFIGVAEHAAKYRRVTDGPHKGSWRHDFAPHTVKIMNTFGLSHVREVWFCGVEQSGKTNTMLNCLHWCADVSPGDIFYLMPTEDTMSRVLAGKIRPMVQQSPRLRKYLSGRESDMTLSRLSLTHGVTIRPSWANSPSSMATWPAKYCFGDEVDKMPERAGRETDPITLIKKRNRLYNGRYKRFFASTPAQMYIWSGLQRCAQIWEYRERCPECDRLVALQADGFAFPGFEPPDDRHQLPLPEDVANSEVSVRIACPECGCLWDDPTRMRAIRAGRWVAVKDAVRPLTVGFHHRAFDCLDVSLTEIAAAWLRAEQGDTTDRIAWANGYEAIDYVHEQRDREEDFILRLKDDSMPRGVVPADTSALVMSVDTQRAGFFYQLWAFGWGRDLTVRVIDHGFLLSFRTLVEKAQLDYADAEGKIYRVQAAFIDSGGGTNPDNPKHSRTVEVYEFCRKNPLFRPLKGRRTLEGGWRVSRLDYYPSSMGKKVPIPGGLKLYTINVTLFKDELDRKLMIEPGDPGSIRLHAEIDREYARMLCAEYRNDRGYWICPKGRDNHQWDVAVYGLALAEIMGIRNRRKEKPKTAVKRSHRRRGFVTNY